jgi:glycosyltransferase involved in cell wall biosynthesis
MIAPQVSVIMAVWNREKYLRSAIESVLNQSFPDFELIIVDDGSTDSSLEISKSYSDSRIRILENSENLGPTLSRNKALQVVKSDFIAILDSDDVAQKDRLKIQLSYLESQPEVACVGSNFESIDESGNCFSESSFPTSELWLRWRMLYQNVLAHSSVMFRKSMVGEKAYNEDFRYAAEDYELWGRLLKTGKRIHILSENLIQLRYHSDNISKHPANSMMEYSCKIKKSNLDSLFGGDVPLEIVGMITSPYEHKNSTCGEAALEYLYSSMIKYFHQNPISSEDKRLVFETVSNDARQIVNATNRGYFKATYLAIKEGANSKNWKLAAKSIMHLWGMRTKRMVKTLSSGTVFSRQIG